jgi:lipoyl(octanoyl) transferase
VRRGCSYHGLSLNIDMELEPFARINPCGYSGLAVTQLRNHGVSDSMDAVADKLLRHLTAQLGIEKMDEGANELPD